MGVAERETEVSVKIFLSWSGARSRAVAEALSTWIPRVIQAVDVFFSPDIEKGAKWGNEITGALEGTSFGIVVVTRDNLTSPWLHYEAGALSKLPGARVWTFFLLDLPNADVPPPLGLFQHTEAIQEDVLKLLRSINGQVREGGEKALAEGVLTETFEDLWPRFAGHLDLARGVPDSPTQMQSTDTAGRGVSAKLDEVLELLRSQQRVEGTRSAEPALDLGDKWLIDKYLAYALTLTGSVVAQEHFASELRKYMGVEVDVASRTLDPIRATCVIYALSKPISEPGFGRAVSHAQNVTDVEVQGWSPVSEFLVAAAYGRNRVQARFDHRVRSETPEHSASGSPPA
jgi:hypothetical protein